MKTSRAFFVALIFVALWEPNLTYSTELTSQQQALKDIQEFANGICTRIPLEVTNTSVELNGQAKAELTGLVKKLANLDISGAANYKNKGSQNVLQTDLADTVKHSDDCRKEIAEKLIEKMIMPTEISGTPKAATPPPDKIKASSPTSFLEYQPKWVDGGFVGINNEEDIQQLKKVAEIVFEECAKCLRTNNQATDPKLKVPKQDGYVDIDAGHCADGVHLLMQSYPYIPPPDSAPAGTMGFIKNTPQWASVNIYPGERVRVYTQGVVNFGAVPQGCLSPKS